MTDTTGDLVGKYESGCYLLPVDSFWSFFGEVSCAYVKVEFRLTPVGGSDTLVCYRPNAKIVAHVWPPTVETSIQYRAILAYIAVLYTGT